MRRAALLLICLTIGSAAGCATAPQPSPTVLTVRHAMTPCPHPPDMTADQLATMAGRVDGDAPFDGPGNVDALTARHQAVRAHVKALEAALRCYDRQAQAGQADEEGGADER